MAGSLAGRGAFVAGRIIDLARVWREFAYTAQTKEMLGEKRRDGRVYGTVSRQSHSASQRRIEAVIYSAVASKVGGETVVLD